MDYKKYGIELEKNQVLKSEEFIKLKKWEDFPLFFTIEYKVNNYFEEVGFWRKVFGLEFLSISKDYAILKHPENSWTFSIKKWESSMIDSSNDFKIQFYTDDLDESIKHIEHSGVEFSIVRISDNQRYLEIDTPNNKKVEVWSGWEDKNSNKTNKGQ